MEADFIGNGVERVCTIRITSRHYVHDPERFARYGITPSLFSTAESADGDIVDPEDFPDEMSDALDEILHLEHIKHGAPEDIVDPYAPEDEYDGECDGDYADDEPLSPVDELNRKLDELIRMLSPDTEEEDDGALIFETRGIIGKYIRDGREVIELSYTEDESMDGTETVVRFDPKKSRAVTISHTGGVMSTLVCEEGVRHITVYKTPLMPFEIAVYTKKCRGFFSPYGGKIEIDYMLELRGADLQRTVMTIEARAR